MQGLFNPVLSFYRTGPCNLKQLTQLWALRNPGCLLSLSPVFVSQPPTLAASAMELNVEQGSAVDGSEYEFAACIKKAFSVTTAVKIEWYSYCPGEFVT